MSEMPLSTDTDAVTPEITVAENSFRTLGLSDALVAAVENSGYTTPTPIQAETIPLLLAGRDVVGQAQTGTGKTGAFALPLLARIDMSVRQPQVLVLTPTRELAIQVAEAFERYAAEMGRLHVAAIYGGQDYQVQFRQLDKGVHVVVGTPGRVMDHMRRGSLKLEGLKTLVLDEADEMLKMGFAEDVEWVLTQLPTERQIALFSATLPDQIRRIAQQHLRNPAHVTIHQRTATADTIRQRYIVAAPFQKQAALGRILEAEPTDGVIVFVRTRSTTEPLAEYLTQSGYRAAALNGDMPQKTRERIIDQLREGKLDILVATDVAARGLDVQRISHVVNYDLPMDSEIYVHRIGRTGRAGRSGEAILFVHPRDRRQLVSLERATRQRIEPMELPSNRAINKQRVAKFHVRITAAMAHSEMAAYTSIVEQYRREHPEVAVEQIAAALAVMANREQSLLVKEEVKAAEFHDTRPSHSDSRPRHDDRRHDDRGPRDGQRSEGGLETFRIEVGHNHQVKPGNIVGAVANETGLSSARIGRIRIFDDHSTIDLPTGMPEKMFYALKKVWVMGRQLEISRLGPARPGFAPRGDKPPPKFKRKKEAAGA